MKFFVLFFTIVVSFFQTSVVMAAEGLVTCVGGDECNFCSFVSMVNGIIEWLIIIAVTLTVLLLAFAGFRLVTSAGDAAALEQAKKIFVSSIIGIMIMLAGWTIVDTFLKLATGGDLGVWNAVECGGAYESAPAVDINIALTTHEGIKMMVVEDMEMQAAGFNDAVLLNAGPLVSVPPSPAGEVCYPSGACFPLVNAGTVGYPVCGFSPPGVIDLGAVNVSTSISSNFTLQSAFGGLSSGYAYVNPNVVARMEQLYEMIGHYTLNNSFRSPATNCSLRNSTCGIPTNSCFSDTRSCNVARCSRHMSGLALDINPPGGSAGRCQVVQACRAAQAGFIMTYNGSGHVHCDWGGSGESLVNGTDPDNLDDRGCR